MTESCEHCAFFEMELGATGPGQCRREPPKPAFGGSPNGGLAILGSGFPPTAPTWWCGEWRKGTLVKVAKSLSPVIPFPGPGKN